MALAPVRLGPAVALGACFDAIRSELDVVTPFPAAVEAEAAAFVERGPVAVGTVRDLRDVAFHTVDPPGSMDLDQAFALERLGSGYRFRYAIADVAAFVAAGGAIDAEARRRGVTIYLPDERSPLHPPSLSEGAASLLPDQERQALVWTIDLDADAEPTSVVVERARVRSRRRWTYAEAQQELDAGVAPDEITLLRDVGTLRQQREADRGGVSLDLPDQVVLAAGGRYDVVFRAPLPTESWNAQLSLLTGIVAARLMLDAGVGVLRTLPEPEEEAVAALRRRVQALGVSWPAGASYAEVVRSLDATVPIEAVALTQAARALRGAGYESFDGAPPEHPVHAAVAAPYAHVTAPLRRLVDRFGNEVVLAVCAGRDVPGWVDEALPALPDLMAEARRREGAADRAAVDVVEAAVLSGRVGTDLDGVVVDADRNGAITVQLREPAVVARIRGVQLVPGDPVRVRVEAVDIAARWVSLRVAGTVAG